MLRPTKSCSVSPPSGAYHLAGFAAGQGRNPSPQRKLWMVAWLAGCRSASVYAARAGGTRDRVDMADGWYIHWYH